MGTEKGFKALWSQAADSCSPCLRALAIGRGAMAWKLPIASTYCLVPGQDEAASLNVYLSEHGWEAGGFGRSLAR